MRLDLEIIQSWIKTDSRVLDLGCGDGSLLQLLRDNRQVSGLGIEIDPDSITQCVSKGIRVIEQDLNQNLSNFQTNSFDYVVMSHSLQTLRFPHLVIDEMLRIGKEGIITFPNFAHWSARWHILTHGEMPVSKYLPYAWYETPNIHFCTVTDFENLCQQQGIKILNRTVVGQKEKQGWIAQTWPNLFGVTAIYHISK